MRYFTWLFSRFTRGASEHSTGPLQSCTAERSAVHQGGSVALAGLLVLISGCSAALPFQEARSDDAVRRTEQIAAELANEPNQTSAWPSLEALTEKQLNGREFTLGKVLAQNQAYTRYYITYTSDGLKISGIMNIPRGDGPFPVLILNHGYIDPDVYTNGRGLRREQDYLARRGYAVVHPDYRNHADSDKDPDAETSLRMGYTVDAMNAITALRAADIPTIDANRVGMLGHSMGGGITLNVLVSHPDLVKAAVLFAPVSSDYRDSFKRWTARRPELAEKIIALHGSPESNPDFWNSVSSRRYFDRIAAPILLHHGTADDDVPLEWSDNTVQALAAANKSVDYQIYEDEPHEFIDAWPLVMRRTVEFFDSSLKTSATQAL